MNDPVLVDKTKCKHTQLHFSSGGQLLTCATCGQRYAVVTHGMVDHGYYNGNLLHGDIRLEPYTLPK